MISTSTSLLRRITAVWVLLLNCFEVDGAKVTAELPVDYRYTSYSELEKLVDAFVHKDIVSYVRLTIDITQNQVLVGARNSLFRLSADNLKSLELARWEPSFEIRKLCLQKGQSEEDCHNFIKVLIVQNNRVLACGTNAFKPECTWRQVDRLNKINETFNGVAMCPYSPRQNATALMTKDGNYYSATVVDITGRDAAIYRVIGKLPPLRTLQYNSKWLNDPNFISSYEIEDFVYFFFREIAVEYINCGKRVYSRVARVCKTDRGGMNLLLENNWTTFLKARLNCSIPGEYPSYFDEIKGTYFLEGQKLIYAIFTTSANSIPGSAVCAYNMTAFHSAFLGYFKFQDNAMSAWTRHENFKPVSRCPSPGSSSKRSYDNGMAQKLVDAQKYQMMDQAVQPTKIHPLYVAINERWGHIVVDHVRGKRDVVFEVVFIATEDGKIKKMVTIPSKEKACLVEELKVVPNGDVKPVKALKLSHKKAALYIGLPGKVIKVPFQRCDRFKTENMCLLSMDPYCGWNSIVKKCTPAPNNQPDVYHWNQNVVTCPILEYPVDGGWSEWTNWRRCKHTGTGRLGDNCLCRTRICDNPKPLLGGSDCDGDSVEVTNCTMHGQWSDWTPWTSCSQTCGFGLQSRTRQCGNPPPQFGGRGCKGSDKAQQYCPGNPQCPPSPINGEWSVWSAWSVCSAHCYGGIQTRRRACSHPPPKNNGTPCIGNKQEWRMCNKNVCAEKTRTGPWSPWIKTNSTNDGYFEQRFRFVCHAPVPNERMIRVHYKRSKVRLCTNNRGCHKSREFRNTVDIHTPVARVISKYCRFRRKLFRKYCSCRTLGVFLVCQKCARG